MADQFAAVIQSFPASVRWQIAANRSRLTVQATPDCRIASMQGA
jgi:hypothetical protein